MTWGSKPGPHAAGQPDGWQCPTVGSPSQALMILAIFSEIHNGRGSPSFFRQGEAAMKQPCCGFPFFSSYGVCCDKINSGSFRLLGFKSRAGRPFGCVPNWERVLACGCPWLSSGAVSNGHDLIKKPSGHLQLFPAPPRCRRAEAVICRAALPRHKVLGPCRVLVPKTPWQKSHVCPLEMNKLWITSASCEE